MEITQNINKNIKNQQNTKKNPGKTRLDTLKDSEIVK
jgi:hypothetical protein